MSFWQQEQRGDEKGEFDLEVGGSGKLLGQMYIFPASPLDMLLWRRESATRGRQWKTVSSHRQLTAWATSNSQTALAQAAANWRTVWVLLALMTVISLCNHRRLVARRFHLQPRAVFCRSRQCFSPNPRTSAL